MPLHKYLLVESLLIANEFQMYKSINACFFLQGFLVLKSLLLGAIVLIGMKYEL